MSQSVGDQAVDLATHLDRDRLTGRLQQMVRMGSENPPGLEKEVAELVASFCREVGLEVTCYEGEPDRPSVVARLERGEGRRLPTAHTSTSSRSETRGCGTGTLSAVTSRTAGCSGGARPDAKGPVAAALEAVEILLATGTPLRGTLELAFVADEETMGFKGAGFLVKERILEPDVAIVGEPTSLRLVRAQRGANWFQIRTKGVAGHGSAPERGVSAIKHMAEIVLQLDALLPDVTHDLLGGRA